MSEDFNTDGQQRDGCGSLSVGGFTMQITKSKPGSEDVMISNGDLE